MYPSRTCNLFTTTCHNRNTSKNTQTKPLDKIHTYYTQKIRTKKETFKSLFKWRERRGSNSRPHAWQACALTKLSYAPIYLVTSFNKIYCNTLKNFLQHLSLKNFVNICVFLSKNLLYKFSSNRWTYNFLKTPQIHNLSPPVLHKFVTLNGLPELSALSRIFLHQSSTMSSKP